MKKIIKLTESDLRKLIEKVIKEQKELDIRVTKGSSAQGKISLINGKKVLTITYESGLNPDQKFIVNTDYPALVEPRGVFVLYKGNNVFELGPNKIKATAIQLIK